MAFHEVRLPDDIERGANGGPRFKTDVFPLNSGREQRNIVWENVRGEWDIGYGLMNMETELAVTHVRQVLKFFMARWGRAYGFRFKDWSDYQIGDPDSPGMAEQLIGLGDDVTTDFQIFKRYTDDGGFTYDRTIRKIVNGSYVVYLDGVAQTEGGGSDYTIDINTGVITFNTAPASTGGSGPGGEEVVAIDCEFDVPVRFEDDHLRITVEQALSGSIPTIAIKELLLDETGDG